MQQQQQTQEGLHVTKLHIKRVATQPTFDEFKSIELQVTLSRLESVEGFMFEFELGKRMVHQLGSFVEGSGDPTIQTSIPKFVEEVVVEVMNTNKVDELFQTMAIVNLNMGNLILKVNTLNNILVAGEKEKAMLQEELDKERDLQKGYKHNVEIWRKNRAKVKQKYIFIKKLQDENEELKGSTTKLKSQNE